ncbi:hypothetical protein BMS3Bbin04_00644 [bacterium BMS3Bbin04]|nr:hypothetical protein BMS3Bbin04_00644 [bacterium BMS3Bbin04]
MPTAKIVTRSEWRALFVRVLGCIFDENISGFVVMHPSERSTHSFQLADVTFEHIQFVTSFVEHTFNDVHGHVFGQLHITFQIHKGDFRFNHPELCQVTAGFGFLRSECRAESINATMSHCTSFGVQLAGLRQECYGVEVFRLEQVGSAFDSVRSEHGRVKAYEAAIVEEVPDSPDDFMTNPQHRMLLFRSQPEVTVIQ